MAKQTGVVVEEAAAPFKVVDNLTRPKPGHKQALVKSLFVAINPVEGFMAQTGVLTTGWPAILGSDHSAVVVETGEGSTRLKKGDHVYGLSRLGQNDFSPFQEMFLVDEDYIFKGTDDLPLEVAAILGTGFLTSALGILVAGRISIPEHGTNVEERDEWIVVLGGSGTVGQAAIQLARLAGYKVIASGSASKAQATLGAGANATVDRHDSVDDQVSQILGITGGRFPLVFDASASSQEVGFKALEGSSEKTRLFTTTGYVSQDTAPESVKVTSVLLGELGRESELGASVSKELGSLIPKFERYISRGIFKPVEYEVFEGVGWDKLVDALAYYSSGKADKKVVVKVQEK